MSDHSPVPRLARLALADELTELASRATLLQESTIAYILLALAGLSRLTTRAASDLVVAALEELTLGQVTSALGVNAAHLYAAQGGLEAARQQIRTLDAELTRLRGELSRTEAALERAERERDALTIERGSLRARFAASRFSAGEGLLTSCDARHELAVGGASPYLYDCPTCLAEIGLPCVEGGPLNAEEQARITEGVMAAVGGEVSP